MALYLETSAAVKLVLVEAESSALRRLWISHDAWTSSQLLELELMRATRWADPRAVGVAGDVLSAVSLVDMGRSTVDRASTLDPPELRSPDAIHLATALGLGPDLEAVVTYDARLSAAASAHGLPVLSPS